MSLLEPRFLLVGLLLLFTGICGRAQNQNKVRTISGTITATPNGRPLAGASVFILDAKLGVAADSNGRYTLRNLPAGHHLIEFSHAGYTAFVVHAHISRDTVLNIVLQPSITENQGVVVTGVSHATSIRKAPIPVTAIRRTQLLQTPATNIVDALTRQPGVAQVSTGPAISKPVIRGLGYNRVVVVNDGVRQEGQQWGDEHGLELDEASVQRAEILKGPASLIYGSDALAGVVNLITNTPVTEGTIKGNVLANYQTNNRLQSYHANIAGNRNGLSWNLYGTLRNAGDYRNRWDGRVLNSRFGERNFGGYLGVNRNWGYSHLIVSSFDQKAGIVEGDRDESSGRFLLYAGSPLERLATAAEEKDRGPLIPYQRIQHYKVVSDNNFTVGKSRLKLNAGFQTNRRREFGNPEDVQEEELFFDLKTVTYNLQWQLPEWRHWRTTLGVNGMYQYNKNRGEERIIPDYRLHDIGSFLFVQGLFPKYTISGGVRFDNRSVHSLPFEEDGALKFIPFTRSFSNASGSAGISYEPVESITLKANVATGFRAPNLAELASNGAHEGTNRYEYGTQSLKSEKSMQGDISAEWNRQHFTLGLSAFVNVVNDFIYYRKLESLSGGDSLVVQDGEALQAFRFAQHDARLAGFEAMLDLHPHPLDWLHFENTLSFVRGRFAKAVDGTRNLPLIPAPRWVSELRADFGKAGTCFQNLYVRLDREHNFGQSRAFFAYNTETETPAYVLWHAGIGADVTAKGKTLFSLYLAAQNLTNTAYQNHLSRLKYTDLNEATGRRGVFNVGRNFSIRVNVPLLFRTK